MPTLLIHKVTGSWVAAPTGHTQYTFKTIDGSQEPAIQQLAAAMQQGQAAVKNGIDEIFNLPTNSNKDQIVQNIFNTTDTLTYVNKIIYGTVAPDMLLDDIELAGETLRMACLSTVV